MPHYTFSGEQGFDAPAYALLPGDELDVLTGANMYGRFSWAPLITAVGAHIDNRGTISSTNNVIRMQGAASLANHGTIVNHAQGGYAAVEFGADPGGATALIVNDGMILAQNNPSYWHNDPIIYGTAIRSSADIRIVNSGSINDSPNLSFGGVGIDVAATAHATIVNSGTIYGRSERGQINAIRAPGGADIFNQGTIGGGVDLGGGTLVNNGNVAAVVHANMIDNGGTITGINDNFYVESFAIGGTDGADSIVNGHAGGWATIGGSISLGEGGDTVDSRNGAIIGNIYLGAGDDRFDATGGAISQSSTLSPTGTATIVAGAGDDIVLGGIYGELIYGDNISGDTSGGADTLYGGWGNDVIYGGYGDDTILGNRDDDTLMGNQGRDFLHGGLGNDILYGGKDDDTLNGGVGQDRLFGNLGNDTFVFSAGFGADQIEDFSAVAGNNDVIRFEAGTFANYAEVQANMVQVAAIQGSGFDTLIFESATGSVIRIMHTEMAALTADHFLFG